MKNSRLNRFSAASLAAMALASPIYADNGTWTQLTSGGLWSDIANWSSGAGPIADGSGSTANFNTLNLTGDNTVQLDGNRTLTNLIFGDTNTSSGGNWIVSSNLTPGNLLTLAGTTPTITVNALAATRIVTINAGITGSAGLIKDGVGTLNLGSASGGVLLSGGTTTLTGGVTIKAGTLGLVGPIGAGSITIGDTVGGSTAAATLNMVGLSTNGVVPSYTSPIVLGATSGLLTITATTSGQLSFSGGITGTNNLTIAENNANSGTITFLTGSVNHTGTFTNAGTGAAGTGVVISSTIGSNVTGVIQNGTTKLVLSGASTAFIGDTTLTAGTLNLQNTNSLQKSVLKMNGGSVTFGTSTTVAITSVALGGLSGSGNINLNNTLTTPTAVNLTIGNSNASYGGNTLNPTYSGALSNTNGAASLTKVGSNTQTLSNTNTYSGATTVTAGTLALGASGTIANSTSIIVGNTGSSGAVLDVSAKTGGFTIGSTQKLSGIGTVDANDGSSKYTVAVNGIHAPGNSVGKQTIDGNLNYATSASIFEWELGTTLKDSSTGTRGTDYDAVNVSGTLAGTDAIFRVVLGDTTNFAATFWDSDHTWTDIFKSADGGTNVSFAAAFLASGFQYSNSTGSITNTNTTGRSFTIDGSSLTWSAVPEPTSALAGLLLGTGLLRRRRKQVGTSGLACP